MHIDIVPQASFIFLKVIREKHIITDSTLNISHSMWFNALAELVPLSKIIPNSILFAYRAVADFRDILAHTHSIDIFIGVHDTTI